MRTEGAEGACGSGPLAAPHPQMPSVVTHVAIDPVFMAVVSLHEATKSCPLAQG
jgi:hypothetical protein